MAKEFYSNGKLLLSGEYAVLDGARALAIPTKYGQSMRVIENTSPVLVWRSFDQNGKIWFEGRYTLKPLRTIASSDTQLSKRVLNILQQAQELNGDFLIDDLGFEVETRMDFPRNWGLGSSSTLVNNIANWANCDPFDLVRSTFGGSGYDIACARNDMPIIFCLKDDVPQVEVCPFEPLFKKQLYFVHLNKKRNSRDAIVDYSRLDIDKKIFTTQISAISDRMTASTTLEDFEDLMKWHEKEIAKVLGVEPIQSRLFPDYWGAIKSLGAWGGDFILATGDKKTPDYFKEKGYETIIPYSHMVLS